MASAVVATLLRTGVQAVARGTYTFGKGETKILSKLGPLFSALGSILSTILSIGSQALMWLSNNYCLCSWQCFCGEHIRTEQSKKINFISLFDL